MEKKEGMIDRMFFQEYKKSNAHIDYLEFDGITNTFTDNFKKEKSR